MSAPKDTAPTSAAPAAGSPSNFIRSIIDEDLRTGKHQRVVTRFPPEPNGWPHIGHAKSISLNFGLARDYGGRCHLRMDDTNPETEDMKYVEALKRDIRWLGYDWGEHFYYASDYYERLYAWAVELIKKGKAYVCDLNEEDVRLYRGTVTEAGRPSPGRDRPVAESLELFERMNRGEFDEGSYTLRAKIDLGSPNMKMRDPLIYRIKKAPHYRRGNTFHVYPMYDFAHCLSDAIEGITHSLCTLEFENNRELYDWFLDQLEVPCHPQQIEFARLSLNYTVMSKRKLLQLVEEGHVDGWDDPRMFTIAGLRRRGYTPEAIRDFCDRIGVARANSTVDVTLLERCVREDLNRRAARRMAVVDPLKVVVESWPEGQVDHLSAPDYPAEMGLSGSRDLPFTRELWIEREDFERDPPKGFFRLAPGREVRLKYAYYVTCTGVDLDDAGRVVAVRCTHDPATRGGDSPDGRKVKGTLHWVSATHGARAEVRLYDRLFSHEAPGATKTADFLAHLNPHSKDVVQAWLEPALASATGGTHYQFERLGFFFVDPQDSTPSRPVFNRTVSLKDTWAQASADAAAPDAKADTKVGARAKSPSPSAAVAPRKNPTEASTRPEHDAATAARAASYQTRGLTDADAATLAADEDLAAYFDAALAHTGRASALANWVLNDLRRVQKTRGLVDLPLGPATLAELVELVEARAISSRTAKELFEELSERGGSPSTIVAERGLAQVDDPAAVQEVVNAVLAENGDAVSRFRAGNTNLLGLFVGQVMKRTGGKANPQLVSRLVKASLG